MSSNRVFVVAEIGVNHNGDGAFAKRLIDVAGQAGADAVKFQTYRASELEPPGPRRDMLARLELIRWRYPRLRERAAGWGMEFFSTPFDVESVAFLAEFGVRTMKLSSGHLQDEAMLRAVADTGCRAILSSGMATMEDIGHALEILPDATVLQCTSAYPAALKDANVRAMQTIRDIFGCPVGLSDHTEGSVAAVVATALGASVIEKHITLDRSLPGPDHAMSADPAAFVDYVTAIRRATTCMGDGRKTVRDCEAPVMEIVAARRAHAR